MGTAEGKELKQPGEKVIFEEDLTADEKAKILKERKVEILPGGLKNLGNTCYMNSCLQCLAKIKELNDSLKDYVVPGADRDIDAVLTNQLKNVFQQLQISSRMFFSSLQQEAPSKMLSPQFSLSWPCARSSPGLQKCRMVATCSKTPMSACEASFRACHRLSSLMPATG